MIFLVICQVFVISMIVRYISNESKIHIVALDLDIREDICNGCLRTKCVMNKKIS